MALIGDVTHQDTREASALSYGSVATQTVIEAQRETGPGKGIRFWFDWSRDGKQLALSRGTQISDVVLISNFT